MNERHSNDSRRNLTPKRTAEDEARHADTLDIERSLFLRRITPKCDAERAAAEWWAS